MYMASEQQQRNYELSCAAKQSSSSWWSIFEPYKNSFYDELEEAIKQLLG